MEKFWEVKECFQPNSHSLDLNSIHENVANLDNDETTKSTSELGIGKGIKNGGSNARYKSALSALAKQQIKDLHT